MADYTPVHTGGAIPFTSQASADVTGGRLVIISGNNTVAPATLTASTVAGVAAHDAVTGAKVTVWPLHNVTHQITSTGTIAAGDRLGSGAAGVAAGIAAGDFAALIGKALAAATGGAEVRFLGY